MQQENGGESCVSYMYSSCFTSVFAVTIFLSGLTGSLVSQSVSQEKIDKFAVFANFLFVFYRRSRVFLWVASADIACLSVDDTNGAL